MKSTKWDNRFLDLAKLCGSWSKDPSTQVGAVIVDDNNRIVSVGYNGFPQGVEDSEERLLDREQKYDIIVHAEANALMFANKSVEGCTLYTWPFQPCSRCAGIIIQSGISRVVSIIRKDERWQKNFKLASKLFEEAGIIVEYLDYE
jgi:dCMP deaminase